MKPRVNRLAILILVGLPCFALLQLFSPASRSYPDAYLLLTLSLSIWVGAMGVYLINKRASPIAFMAAVYFIFFFHIPALGHLTLGRFPFFNGSYSSEVAFSAATATLFFTVVFVLVTTLSYGDRATSTLITAATAPEKRLLRRPVYILLLLALTAALAVGYGYLGINRGDRTETLTPLSLVLVAVARSAPFLATIYAALALQAKPRSGFNWVLLAVCTLAFAAANNPLAVSRFTVGAYAVTTLLVFLPFSRFVRTLIVTLAPLAQLTLFPYLTRLTRGGNNDIDPFDYLFTHGDFDGFQSTMSVVSWVDSSGMQLGKQFASFLLFFVPSGIAGWKSPGTGIEAATYMQFPYTNLSSPLPAELYADFGLAGLFLLAALVAWGISKVDHIFATSFASNNSFGKVFPALIAGYTIILMRGSLVSVAGPFACAVALALLARWLSKRTQGGGEISRSKSRSTLRRQRAPTLLQSQ